MEKQYLKTADWDQERSELTAFRLPDGDPVIQIRTTLPTGETRTATVRVCIGSYPDELVQACLAAARLADAFQSIKKKGTINQCSKTSSSKHSTPTTA